MEIRKTTCTFHVAQNLLADLGLIQIRLTQQDFDSIIIAQHITFPISETCTTWKYTFELCCDNYNAGVCWVVISITGLNEIDSWQCISVKRGSNSTFSVD